MGQCGRLCPQKGSANPKGLKPNTTTSIPYPAHRKFSWNDSGIKIYTGTVLMVDVYNHVSGCPGHLILMVLCALTSCNDTLPPAVRGRITKVYKCPKEERAWPCNALSLGCYDYVSALLWFQAMLSAHAWAHYDDQLQHFYVGA